MSVYMRWNDGLATHFFSPANAGRAVYLYVDEVVVRAVGQPLGYDLKHFLWSVNVVGPSWARREGLCQRALEALRGWRERGLQYPPYIGYLALFVLAAGADGDFAPHAYYPRLRKLLGLPTGGQLASFQLMLGIWDDLEQWSTRDTEGALGIFQTRLTGNFIHVGVPIAQRLLTDSDRRNLPRVFARSGMDPTSAPSDQGLIRALQRHGDGLLQQRTLNLLRQADSPLLAFVTDIARDELVAWDGEIPAERPEDAGTIRGSLRLVLRTDFTARVARFDLRCRLNREFPDAGLELTSPGGHVYYCIEAQTGWSSPLSSDSSGGGRLDAAKLDWSAAARFRDPAGWEFVMPASDVRIFVDGRSENVLGDVEVHELPRGKAFRIAYHERAWPLLEDWATSSCEGFEDLAVDGLPVGWRLGSVTQALTDAGISLAFPRLAFSVAVRVRFVSGVKAGSGSNYLPFALPYLVLDAADPADVVRCQGTEIAGSDVLGRFVLPPTLAEGERALIEVVRNGAVVRRQSIYVSALRDWRQSAPGVGSDAFGQQQPLGQGGAIVGANADAASGAMEFRPYPFLLKALRARANRQLFLVGSTPGQVIEWPGEPLPTDWIPIWAIRKQRGKEPLFCGRGIEDSAPRSPVGEVRDGAVLKWQRLVWTSRDHVEDPAEPIIGRLWKRYQELARDL